MMLDAGAETDLVNSVGRTAAQMAAFVGEANPPVSSNVTLSRCEPVQSSSRAT